MIEGMRLISAAQRRGETYRVPLFRGLMFSSLLSAYYFVRGLFDGQTFLEGLVDVGLFWLIFTPVAFMVCLCGEAGRSLKSLAFMDAFTSSLALAGCVWAILIAYLCAWMVAEGGLSEVAAIRGALIVAALVLYVMLQFVVLCSRIDWNARAGGVRADK
jgi:Na+/alanine symporter